MKKKFIFLSSLILITGLFCSFNKPVVKSIKGYISSYGNVPFTRPGIKTEDGKVYGIIAEPDVKQALLNSQGHKVVIQGVIYSREDSNPIDCMDDGSIELHSWKFAKK